MTNTGALDLTVRPVSCLDPQSGPDTLLEALTGLHHLPPLGGTDGPVPQVPQTGEVGAGPGQGCHREEGEGDDQETLLAGGQRDDQSPQLSQRVHTQYVGQTGVSQ